MSAKESVITIQLPDGSGTVLLVDLSCTGMVGETITYQKALFFPTFDIECVTARKLSFPEVKTLLDEYVRMLVDWKENPQGDGDIAATYGDNVLRYIKEQQQNHIDNVINFLYNMSPEGQKEQYDNMNAEAIARVI